MSNRTERDLSPDPREMGRRRFMIEYNDRAKDFLEALGFVREGCLQRDFYREGSYHDIVLSSMFREPK